MTRYLLGIILVTFLGGTAFAQTGAKEKKPDPKKDAGRLPHTKLMPAKLIPDLCVVKYRVSTASPECQAFFDQGLGYYYSYVWMEAARSFEKWGKAAYAPPLKKAQELMPYANEREMRLIKARLQEKGLIETVKLEDRKKEAIKTLDELLTLFDDDEEGWFARAQVADGPNASVPFHKALLRLNPLHPGANHELVHHYENIRRPALGWPHAEAYFQSSSNIPHACHMQAHLAMRIGKWEKTTDRSSRAIELEVAYHKLMNVQPNEDHQFSHHLETLMQSLIHDGRFKEAQELRKKCEGYKYTQRNHWFRLAIAQRDWNEALKQANATPKDKITTSYMRALVYLNKGDFERAKPEINVLQQAYATDRKGKDLELRLWLAQGLYQCSTGGGDGGVKLLAKMIEKTKDDYGKHAWGHGAYYMEYWGLGALRANRLDVAEEAFLEALAHDAGSVKGALGMMVVCERQGRAEEMNRFAELAQRCWRKADAGLIQAELEYLRGQGTPASASVGAKN